MLAFVEKCRCAVFADIIRMRPVALAVAGMGAAQLVASCFNCGLPCPFHQVSGQPCPGCGLTRSVLALMRGNVGDSIGYHPFGPLLLLGLITAMVTGLLPESSRQRMIRAIARFERLTGCTSLILALLMLTWVLRLGGLLPLKLV